MKKKLSLSVIFLSFIALLVLWTLRYVFLKPLYSQIDNLWIQEIVQGLFKIVIWGVLAFGCLKAYGRSVKIPEKKMWTNHFSWGVFLPIGGVFLLVYVVRMFRAHGGFAFPENFEYSQIIGTVILAGILEEYFFRGWILNGLMRFMNEELATGLTSLLFVLIHFPIWIAAGYTIPVFISNCFSVFILGYVFGYAFRESKCLWVCICLHMLWNFLVIIG